MKPLYLTSREADLPRSNCTVPLAPHQSTLALLAKVIQGFWMEQSLVERLHDMHRISTLPQPIVWRLSSLDHILLYLHLDNDIQD
jgi:hypothetical protein